MFGGMKAIRMVQATHGKADCICAFALRKKRGTANGAESPSQASIAFKPSDRAVRFQTIQRHQYTGKESTAGSFLAAVAMANPYVYWRGVGGISTCAT